VLHAQLDPGFSFSFFSSFVFFFFFLFSSSHLLLRKLSTGPRDSPLQVFTYRALLFVSPFTFTLQNPFLLCRLSAFFFCLRSPTTVHTPPQNPKKEKQQFRPRQADKCS
jgi:hypothetical protein